MKKNLKIGSIIIFIIFISLVGLVLFGGPQEPVVLTEEEEQAQQQEQIELYQDVNLSSFDTKAITGEMVTSDYFKDYQITMVNLWFTGCGPCIEEMPEIVELSKNMPEGASVITICTDTFNNKDKVDEDAVEFAQKVMEDAGANFLTLIPDRALKEHLTDRVNIFPTTIFVDSEGKVIGKPHFGDRSAEDYRAAILEHMELLDHAEE